jgi:P4 family phage/plasmid primase-like protien
LDVDPRNGGDDTLARIESEIGALPISVESLTGGGGRHLVFAYPHGAVPKDSAGKLLGSGVDVLSDGSIMVVPPSLHSSGRRYKWRVRPSNNTVVPLPDQWLSRMRSPKSTNSSDPAASGIAEGERNNTLTSIAGQLVRSRISPEAILPALLADNQARCKPPLPEAEVTRIAKSAQQFAAGVPGQDDAEVVATLVLQKHFAGGKHLLFGVDGRFWHYNGKKWEVAQEKWIENRILDAIKVAPLTRKPQTQPLAVQVSKLLAAQLASQHDRLGFAEDPQSIINCRNCEVWILPDGKIEQRPHNPESYLRHCLDVDYLPKAKCPEYDEALLGIFANTSKPKAMRKLWNELVGYIIQPKRDIATIVILLGVGNNGKTALVKTIIKLLGNAQVHAQRVDALDRNRFAMGSLLGKLLFVDDDVSAGTRLPDGILKTISEAKEVTGELKHRDPFNFVVRTVPLLLCNNVPSLADVSQGMLRRLIVIPFDRSFTVKDDDKGLFERIRANELSGVLNRALKGYVRLQKRQRFQSPVSVKKALSRWLEQANPLPAFIKSRCVKHPGKRCLRRHLYKTYQDWAKDSGFTMVQTEGSFVRNLNHLGFKDIHARNGRTIIGLDLKPLS